MHRKMVGRPSNPHPTKAVKITATPKLLAYLDDLKVEEGYGNSRGEIALRLVWRAVEELISRGVLTRRPGSHDTAPGEAEPTGSATL